MSKIFVIILNWNRAKDTIECIKSLQKIKENLEIVVVDNASVDDSVLKIENSLKSTKFKFSILRNDTNLGFAEGNNVGIKYALKNGANYVMVLNNDTIVDKNIVFEFLLAAKENPKAGVFSPKIYFAPGFEYHKKRYKKTDQGRVIWYAGGIIDWNNVYGINRGVDEVDSGQYENVETLDFATGACMFLRASALREVGLFNKLYFMYLEDADLSLRFKKCGWEVLYVPRARLWHKVAQSSGIGSGLNDYFLTRNRINFAVNYAPLRAKAAVIKESFKLWKKGRPWQRRGARDFYLGKFGKGSWK
jgi:hypothetical protein